MDSKEDLALIQYLKDAGIPYGNIVTTNHPKYTASGNLSRHCLPGTDGEGLAVDFGNPGKPGRDTPELKAITEAFYLVKSQIHELIYAGGPGIYKGQDHTYSPAILAMHHDHTHVSVDLGTFLKWQSGPSNRTEFLPMKDGEIGYIFVNGQSGPGYGFTLDGGVYPRDGAVPHKDSTGAENSYGRSLTPIIKAYVSPNGDGYTLLEANGTPWPFGPGAPRIPKIAVKYTP